MNNLPDFPHNLKKIQNENNSKRQHLVFTFNKSYFRLNKMLFFGMAFVLNEQLSYYHFTVT